MKKGPPQKEQAAQPGAGHSAPYPLSRLSPPIALVDLAREIDQADRMLHTKAAAQLAIIADQIHALQKQARAILEKTKRDQELHRAHCGFQKRPGKHYYLYAKENGTLYFSLLSPLDWQNTPPHPFRGRFRLESDYSWTPSNEEG